MTDRSQTDPAARDPAVTQAKGAAREAIGKLIGDDDAVREGQRQQVDKPAPSDPTKPTRK